MPQLSKSDVACLQIKLLRSELSYDAAQEAAEATRMRHLMTETQALAFDDIIAAVDSGQGGVFFVDGVGGGGKTFLYTALLHCVRGESQIAVAAAFSGVAALLLKGGQTAHKRFGLPVTDSFEEQHSTLSMQDGRAELLRQSALILWDEACMASRGAVDAVDRLLQDVTECKKPAGGKVWVLGGDLRQTLPREATVVQSAAPALLPEIKPHI